MVNAAPLGREARRLGSSPFGDTYWWQGKAPPSADAAPNPEQVDRAEYRELADSLPTLCWIANPDGYITWYNRRWHEYCGTTPEEMEGWGWQSVHDPEVLPAVMQSWTASIATGEPFEMVFPLRGADGVFRPFLTRIIPLRDEAGAVRRWIGNNIDISRQVAVEQELRRVQAELETSNRQTAEREAFLSSVLSASTDCIKVVELDGSLSFMSKGGMRTMEISDFNEVRGCPWPDFLKGEGSGLAREAIEAAREGRTTHFEADANTYLGTPKHWSVSVSPIPGPDGRVERVLSVSRDHTALAHAREQQQLLNGELSHRLKNTLTVIQAIAFQTLGGSIDQAALDAFGERIAALSQAHEVLVRQNWTAAGLGEVARSVLATFDGGGRIAVTGPSTTLGPRAALALSLLLHEFATNATKHGALSVPEGRVTVSWSRDHDGEDGGVTLRWEERGGPPAVEPTRRGFGSRIIRMGLSGSGGTTLRYGPEGLTAEMKATAAQLSQA